MAPFGDILSALESARQAAWADHSPLHNASASASGGAGGSGSASGASGASGSGGSNRSGIGSGSVGMGIHHRQKHGHRGHSMHGAGLPNSHSQPIYVPGKYSPSSCLSDKEEDEIYGFGYGVFAPRVARGGLTQQQQLLQQQTLQTQQSIQQQQQMQQQLQQQQQQLPLVPGQQQAGGGQPGVGPQHHQTLPPNVAHLNFVQQNCLSPRSAYFYEFPPTAEGRETKKRTTLARLLKGLKTVNRRDRNNQQNGAQARAANDRLRHFQMINGGAGGQQHSFEETIHRLKVQEAMRKKEKFQREHEEILRDIRQGLLQMSRGEGRMDDTYMYDEALRTGAGVAMGMGIGGGAHYAVSALHHQGHWYDEPPYESDPDDFLMAGLNCGPAATIQGGRVRFSNNRESTGVISLRSAGDISLPQRGPPSRGLIVPQQPPNPPTIIPLTHARSHDRESGDYAGSISDLQSVTSRLSAVSIGTNNCTARYRTLSGGIGESPSLSPSPSSDYEDIGATRMHGLAPSLLAAKAKKNGLPHGKANTICQKATVHHSSEMRSSPKEIGTFNENGRNFVATKDTSRDFSNSQDNTDRGSMSDQAFACSASSVESLPSASGSSTQALVRPGSPHSSISAEDRTSMAVHSSSGSSIVQGQGPGGQSAQFLRQGGPEIYEGRAHRCPVDERLGHLEGSLPRPGGTLQVHQRGSAARAAPEELQQQDPGPRLPAGRRQQRQCRQQQRERQQQRRRRRRLRRRTQLGGGSAGAHRPQGVHVRVRAQRGPITDRVISTVPEQEQRPLQQQCKMNERLEKANSRKASRVSHMDIDESELNDPFQALMEKAGNHGRYQTLYNFLFVAGLAFSGAMIYMNIILALNIPHHWCTVHGRENTNFTLDQWRDITLPKQADNRGRETFSNCEMYQMNFTEIQDWSTWNTSLRTTQTQACQNGWSYDKTWYESTIPTDHNWVCAKDLFVTNVFVVGRVTEVAGSFILGQMGDSYGRRLVYYISVVFLLPGTHRVHHVHQLVYVVPHHVRHRGPHRQQSLPVAPNHWHGNLTGGGSQSHCLLPELRLVHWHHVHAAALLVAGALVLLYVAHIVAHGDGFNFLQKFFSLPKPPLAPEPNQSLSAHPELTKLTQTQEVSP
ncbi:GL23211 [Drosophila persimilis]|uniref:GL23211 n=1 Tax=Drosophila persimilis TaxID=7234 RepID=B4G5B5_DROPE|nr:GL23211 [Drosophila persimilis]